LLPPELALLPPELPLLPPELPLFPPELALLPPELPLFPPELPELPPPEEVELPPVDPPPELPLEDEDDPPLPPEPPLEPLALLQSELAPLRHSSIVVMVEFTDTPVSEAADRMPTPINATIRPYSIADAPELSSRRFFIAFFVFNIVIRSRQLAPRYLEMAIAD
jgi:hypothetical protein